MPLDRRRAAAFLWAALVDILAVGALIIVHEEDSALKAFLNRLTGHHWVTKSLLTIVLFPGLSVLFYRAIPVRRRILASDRLALWAGTLSAVTGVLVVGTLAFFILGYLAS